VTALRNVGAIVGKEWRHYFGGPIAYVAFAIWTLLFGFFFYRSLYIFLRVSAEGQAQRFGGVSLNDFVIGGTLQTMAVITLFLTPILTMRLFAEEKRQGTIELLSTAPITEWQVVLGKFAGALSLFALMLLIGSLNFVSLWRYAINAPDWRPLLTGLLAMLLLAATCMAIGLLLSTFTSNQIVAATLSFGVMLVLWVLGHLDEPGSTGITHYVAQLGLVNHLEDMLKGIIDLKDVAFFLSATAFCLFLAHQSVESQRWRA
jgi:ABC-2 type transport system permease protein